MNRAGNIPAAVLTEQLSDAIAGRRVRAAAFTTFTFDPSFFELHVLPSLSDQSFSQVDKVRLIQLEDVLQSVDVGVYYDRSGLSQDALPAQLDYRRHDVRRPIKGASGAWGPVFHPKLALVLVENEPATEDDDSYQSLVVMISSANLTRAGYWENVEAAHIEVVDDVEIDGQRCSFRPDLLGLVNRIKGEGRADDDHSALDAIHHFVLTRLNRSKLTLASVKGRYYTRIFYGQGSQALSDWLEELRLGRHDWNLEILSPYFDAGGLGALERIIEALSPRETRVFLPVSADGVAEVTSKIYAAMEEMDGCSWASLGGPIQRRGKGEKGNKMAPRRVHAKVYRLWRKGGREVWLVGSANLTSPGHSKAGAGNLEAVFLVDVTAEKNPKTWWLKPLEKEASAFVDESPSEAELGTAVPFDISLRFDWATGELSYFLGDEVSGSVAIHKISGAEYARIEDPESERWCVVDGANTEDVRTGMLSSSLVKVEHEAGSWRVLVAEENMAHRPSLLKQLSPEEILEYWSLLSAEQRAAFIEDRLAAESELEGLELRKPGKLIARNTLFDRFAGIFHAFGCLRRHAEESLREGREREAEAKLLGAKYDSLPALLRKSLDGNDGDPIVRYMMLLCARDLVDRLSSNPEYSTFFEERPAAVGALSELVNRLPEMRALIPLEGEAGQFFEWYEEMFLEGQTG